MSVRIAPAMHRLGRQAGVASPIDRYSTGWHRNCGWLTGQTHADDSNQSKESRAHFFSPNLRPPCGPGP
jgi:hypothetical protein